jgi:hypothetical protein
VTFTICLNRFVVLGEDWPPHCPHWRECKLKHAPILCLLIRNWVSYGLIWYFWNQIWSKNLKIDKLPILGFLPQGNEGVGSPWPFVVHLVTQSFYCPSRWLIIATIFKLQLLPSMTDYLTRFLFYDIQTAVIALYDRLPNKVSFLGCKIMEGLTLIGVFREGTTLTS